MLEDRQRDPERRNVESRVVPAVWLAYLNRKPVTDESDRCSLRRVHGRNDADGRGYSTVAGGALMAPSLKRTVIALLCVLVLACVLLVVIQTVGVRGTHPNHPGSLMTRVATTGG